MNQPHHIARDLQLESLGRWACMAEIRAANQNLSMDERVDAACAARVMRDEQTALLSYAEPPYEYANVLDEGPNVSHKPAPVDPCAWVGACVALTIEAATALFCFAVYAAAKLAWRLL